MVPVALGIADTQLVLDLKPVLSESVQMQQYSVPHTSTRINPIPT
jgi:hypothetical protein